MQYHRSRDWRKTAVLENGGKWSHNIYLTKKKRIRDLKISGGIGGDRQQRGGIAGGGVTVFGN